jgi:hypothetical protein
MEIRRREEIEIYGGGGDGVLAPCFLALLVFSFNKSSSKGEMKN